MLKVFHGDIDRLELHSDYIKHHCGKEGKICKSLFNDNFTLDNLYTSYFQQDIFSSSNKKFDVILYYCTSKLECENLDYINIIKQSKKQIYVILYVPIPPKNSHKFKVIGSDNFFELKTINDGFGGYSKKEYNEVRSIVLNVLGDVQLDVDNLIQNYKYGGIIKTLVNINELNLPIEGIYELLESTDEYFLMSITNAIQSQNNNRIYQYINNKNIKYESILMILQNMYSQLSKVLHAYKNENYEVDFNSLNERVKDVNKYNMYRNASYMKSMGHEGIDYIYHYMNEMLVHLTNSSLAYSDRLKLQDLARVVRGEKSILI